MASPAQAEVFDDLTLAGLMWGMPTPTPHPSLRQIEKDIATRGRLSFQAARTNQTPAIKQLLEDLKDGIPKLLAAREWEMHHMTWTIHAWDYDVRRFAFYW